MLLKANSLDLRFPSQSHSSSFKDFLPAFSAGIKTISKSSFIPKVRPAVANKKVKEVVNSLLDRLGAPKTGRNYNYYVLTGKGYAPGFGDQKTWEGAAAVTIPKRDRAGKILTDKSGNNILLSILRTNQIEDFAKRYGFTIKEAEESLAAHELMHNNFLLWVKEPKDLKDTEAKEKLLKQDEFICLSAHMGVNKRAALLHALSIALRYQVRGLKVTTISLMSDAVTSTLEKTFKDIGVELTPLEFLKRIDAVYPTTNPPPPIAEPVDKVFKALAGETAKKTGKPSAEIYKNLYDKLEQNLEAEENSLIETMRPQA